MDQEVQWFLTEQLVQARTLWHQRSQDIVSWRSSTLGHFGAALEAFRYLKVITDEESADWYRRALSAVGIALTDAGSGARGIYLGEGDSPALPDAPMPKFPRHIEGVRGSVRVQGGRLRVLDADYDDSVTLVRWEISPIPDVELLFPNVASALEHDTEGMDDWAVDHFRQMSRNALQDFRLTEFGLSDDVDTTYVPQRRTQRGDGSTLSGVTAFLPGTPSHATRLDLAWHGKLLPISLD
jgi:hypothetical protein